MKWLWVLLRRLTGGLLFALLVVLFVFVVLWDSVVITIPAGHGGVMWYRFFGGTVATPGPPLREGINLIYPWDRIFVYNLRLQARGKDYQVVSKDGLHYTITMNYRWEPFPRNLGILHRHIGPDYEKNLLIPEIGSVARHVVSRYTAVSLFSDRRADVQKLIYEEIVATSLRNGIGKPGEGPKTTNVIKLENILITEVFLPDQIRGAIENKLEQAQIVDEYKFRVARERLESERKAVEAEGIRRFQETVAPAITPSYLRWRGIEATLKLSQSNNSKVVIIGSGPGGLPIILDGVDRKSEPAPSLSQALAPARVPSPQPPAPPTAEGTEARPAPVPERSTNQSPR
ncbi:MAG: prohibitin family protein [Rhodospirillaceae bacterium]|jgi:regulator of protease activity HflC (stomatin/prohibitin superfamily)|nr:prohibitin family protein [Verrucomicrobiota bacterium]MBT4564448.1 prohibitin family protein [Rhodospirillaceae bacterium]MBT6675474.1 prohibitin family protein [Rhodospirillaceae bacterium]